MAKNFLYGSKIIRGIRDSIPEGYVLGRASKGKGPVQLIKMTTGFFTPGGGGSGGGGSSSSAITALTGDVTATGPGSVAATIANNAVSNAKLADMAAWTLKARMVGSSGDPSDAALADFTTATPVAADFLIGFLSTGELRKFAATGLGKIYAPLTTGVLSGGTDPEFVVTAAGECIMAEIT